jgi:hypothetical protein
VRVFVSVLDDVIDNDIDTVSETLEVLVIVGALGIYDQCNL